MSWMRLTSSEGHGILINMANVVSVIPYEDTDGASSKLFSVATSALGDTTYTQAITVVETIEDIAAGLKV